MNGMAIHFWSWMPGMQENKSIQRHSKAKAKALVQLLAPHNSINSINNS
jgi:hypothetical protein